MQILIVEDEVKIANLLRRGFKEERYAVDIAYDGEEACHSDISTTTIYITLANIDVENGMKSFKGFV